METLLADLVKAIKSNKPHLDQVDLPIFHPATDDVNNWLQQVEGIKGELEWSDVDVLNRCSVVVPQSPPQLRERSPVRMAVLGTKSYVLIKDTYRVTAACQHSPLSG
jgi:hypothetical protein